MLRPSFYSQELCLIASFAPERTPILLHSTPAPYRSVNMSLMGDHYHPLHHSRFISFDLIPPQPSNRLEQADNEATNAISARDAVTSYMHALRDWTSAPPLPVRMRESCLGVLCCAEMA